MFNPLFWLRLALIKIIRIPFWFLGAAGFDAERIQKTTVGRVLKAIGGFVAFVAALLAVLQALGWLDPAKTFVHAIVKSR
jgi:Na+/melibiose symporter-like transporter